MSHLFNAHYRNALNYDLVLNTDHVPVPDCIDLITHLVARENFRESENFRREAEKLAAACDGVTGVDNRLIVVDNRHVSMS